MKNVIGFLILFVVLTTGAFAQTSGGGGGTVPVIPIVNVMIPDRVSPPGWVIRVPIYIEGNTSIKGIDVTVVYPSSGLLQHRYGDWLYLWSFSNNGWLTSYPYVSANADTMRFALAGDMPYKLSGDIMLAQIPIYVSALSQGEIIRLGVKMSVIVSVGGKDTLISAGYIGGHVTGGPIISDPGEIDQDKIYSIMDVLDILKIGHQDSSLKVTLSDSLRADVSGDGIIDSYDGYEDLQRVTNPYWIFEVQDQQGSGAKGSTTQNPIPAGVVVQQTVSGVNIILAKNDSIIHNGDLYITSNVSLSLKLSGDAIRLTRNGNISHLSFITNAGIPTDQSILFLGGVKAEDVRVEGMINNEVPISAVVQRTTGVAEKNDIPLTFNLLQNYPNPFNPTTTIAYDLPLTANVRLEVFDLTGRSVKTLIDKTENAGSHTVIFDASGFASGMYFYRVQAGTFSAIQKMVLLK